MATLRTLMTQLRNRRSNEHLYQHELRDIYVGIFIIELGNIIRFIETNSHLAESVSINSLIDIYTTLLKRCVLPADTPGHIPSKATIRQLKRITRLPVEERLRELSAMRDKIADEQQG